MSTVEILNKVISFIPLKDATRCARVCKGWLDVSLDHIWVDVPGFKPLFEVLAPLSKPIDIDGAELDAPLVFSRPITLHCWRRLTPLLRRVESFIIDKYDGIGESHMFLDNSVFESVLFTRPSTTFVPDLRRLVIRFQGLKFDRAEQFLIVLSESATRLDIRVLESSLVVKNLAYFMLEAAGRAPNLKHISFWDGCRKPAFEKHIQEVFPKFVALESILLSSCTLNATMISALSRLPSLRKIQFGWWGTYFRTEDVKSIHGAIPGSDTCTGPPFPKLRFFSLQSQLSSVTRFLSEKFSPSMLQRLSIDVISPMVAGDLSKLLLLLARKCKSLTTLHILRQGIGIVRGDTITADTLRHLKDLPRLQVFTLHYAQRLDVSDRELAQIILSCRKLRSFRLFHDPLTMGDGVSTLTLNLLSMLADGEGRSELADLFVDVDARDPPSPRPIHVQTLCLSTLSFGFSITLPGQISRVAAYLDSVLNKIRCFRLITNTSILLNPRKSAVMDKTTKEVLEGRAAHWKSVSDSLELITATRRQTDEEIQRLRDSILVLENELDEAKQKLSENTLHDRDENAAESSTSFEILDDDNTEQFGTKDEFDEQAASDG